MTTTSTPNDDETDGDENHQLIGSLPNINTFPIVATTIVAMDTADPLITKTVLIPNRNESHPAEHASDFNQLQIKLNSPESANSPPEIHNHLPISNSENSLNRPLLTEVRSQVPVYSTNLYNEEERISSSDSSTTSDRLNYRKSRMFMLNYFNDMFISAFLITPLLNIHWRGAWDLLDIHFLPDNPYTSALISLAIGLVILCIIYLSQGYCQVFYEKNRRNTIGKIMTRSHSIILGFAYIQQWRGIWNLMDLTTDVWYYLLAETIVCIIVLLMMGDIYNLNSAPFLTGVDTESYFIIDAKYQISTKSFIQRSFDFIFYEVIEAPLLIVAWHGLYTLSDSYISPDNKELSTIISFSSGYAAYFALAIMQIPVLRCLIKLGHSWIYTCVSNIFHLIAFVSVVQIWRSLWLICEQYLNIPGYHDLTLWLCYGGAVLILICGFTVCSLNGPAGSKDIIHEDMMPFFQFDYLSIMLRHSSKTPKDSKSTSLSIEILSAEIMNPIDRL